MTKIIKRIKTKIVFTNNLIFFLLCSFLCSYLLPQEKRFEYEYTQSKPWLHESLYAPFDFPVQKTATEIQQEQIEIQNRSLPVFNFNDSIYIEMDGLVDDFQLEQVDKEFLKLALKNIYSNPIANVYLINKQVELGKTELIINKNHIATKTPISSVLNLKTAYQLLKQKVSSNRNLSKISLSNLMKVNCELDVKKTQKIIENSLRDLSVSKGVVVKGEKIVSKGELINPQIYNKLESLRLEYDNYFSTKESEKIYQIVSNILLLGVLFLLYFLYLYRYEQKVFYKMSNVIFLLILISIMVTLTKLCSIYGYSYYLIPTVVVALMSAIFINFRVAFVTFMLTVVILCFHVPNPFEYLFVQMVAGIIGIYTIKNLFQRSHYFISIFYVFLSYVLVYLCFELMKTGSIFKVDYWNYIYFVINTAILMSSYILIYLIEKSFGFLSNISLMELSDSNQPLLRELAERAPGTFQHSMQVANIAQEAAYKIGANPLLIRAGAYYHDIGKIFTPHMFIENQGGDPNIHDNMPPEKSAELIINHVIAGEENAKKKNIPKQIIDFIITHHGDRKLIYFLQKYKQMNPNTKIDESVFKYKGKRPFTKETAILMMADSVEAASRSIKQINEQKIIELVNNLIDKQISEDQFNDVDLSFKDIKLIKEVFIKKLKDIYHERIEYPNEDA